MQSLVALAMRPDYLNEMRTAMQKVNSLLRHIPGVVPRLYEISKDVGETPYTFLKDLMNDAQVKLPVELNKLQAKQQKLENKITDVVNSTNEFMPPNFRAPVIPVFNALQVGDNHGTVKKAESDLSSSISNIFAGFSSSALNFINKELQPIFKRASKDKAQLERDINEYKNNTIPDLEKLLKNEYTAFKSLKIQSLINREAALRTEEEILAAALHKLQRMLTLHHVQANNALEKQIKDAYAATKTALDDTNIELSATRAEKDAVSAAARPSKKTTKLKEQDRLAAENTAQLSRQQASQSILTAESAARPVVAATPVLKVKGKIIKKGKKGKKPQVPKVPPKRLAQKSSVVKKLSDNRQLSLESLQFLGR